MLTNELELVLEDSWRKKHTEKKEEGVDRIKIGKKLSLTQLFKVQT